MKHFIYKWVLGYRYMIIRLKLSGPRREPIGAMYYTYFKERAPAIELADKTGELVLDLNYRKVYDPRKR